MADNGMIKQLLRGGAAERRLARQLGRGRTRLPKDMQFLLNTAAAALKRQPTPLAPVIEIVQPETLNG